MAERFQIPLEKVQQIAFRLIVVGLVEEVPDIDAGWSIRLMRKRRSRRIQICK